MDFGGDMGLWQRKIATSSEGAARRMAVYEALAIESGQAILDLGCGGGHLVREIALAVGDGGRVVGLDASADQLKAADFPARPMTVVVMYGAGGGTDTIMRKLADEMAKASRANTPASTGATPCPASIATSAPSRSPSPFREIGIIATSTDKGITKKKILLARSTPAARAQAM